MYVTLVTPLKHSHVRSRGAALPAEQTAHEESAWQKNAGSTIGGASPRLLEDSELPAAVFTIHVSGPIPGVTTYFEPVERRVYWAIISG